MDWATKRKFTYIGIVALIIASIVGFWVYQTFFTTPPTCFDEKKNQNERGVDCGGTCRLMCTADVRPLIPLWTRPFNITGDVYSVVAYIENQNVGNGIKEIPYEIRLFDDRNILVSEPIIGTTFIGPNDRTAIYETAIKVGNRIPKTAFLKFLEPPQFLRTDPLYNNQNLVVENDVLTDLDTAPKLSVDIKNVSQESYNQIPIVVILYGTDGNAMATSQTFIEQIGSEETQTVYFSWPEPFQDTPVRREIIPRINPFAQE